MTKKAKITAHLKRYKSIDSITAFEKYGTTRLSAVIHTLKKEGMSFNKKFFNRFDTIGNKISCVKYTVR